MRQEKARPVYHSSVGYLKKHISDGGKNRWFGATLTPFTYGKFMICIMKFITDDHWSGIWLLDQNLSFWSKFCLHETLQPRFTPQCRMGYGFCCPNTTWRSCVGSHVWHRNTLDRSTTLRSCHWSPTDVLRWLGWLYVRTIAGSTIQPKIDWIRHDMTTIDYI